MKGPLREYGTLHIYYLLPFLKAQTPMARVAQILGFTAQRLALVAAAALTVAAPFGGLLLSLALAGYVTRYINDDPVTPAARRRGQDHQ